MTDFHPPSELLTDELYVKLAATSIIFVSQNLNMVQAICPESIYIEQGMVKFQGKTSDVIDKYERDLHEERARKFEAAQTDHATFHGAI